MKIYVIMWWSVVVNMIVMFPLHKIERLLYTQHYFTITQQNKTRPVYPWMPKSGITHNGKMSIPIIRGYW